MGTVRTGFAQVENPKFVLGKSYKWDHTDEFVLKGQEFEFLLETMRNMATKPQGATALAIVNAHAIFENLLVSGVELEVIKEQVETPISSTEEIAFVDMPNK